MTRTDHRPPAAGPAGGIGEISSSDQQAGPRCDATAPSRRSAPVLQGVVEVYADQLNRLDGHHGNAVPTGLAVRVRLPSGRDYRFLDLATVGRIAAVTYGRRYAQIVGPDGVAVAQVLREVAQRHEQWDAAEAELAAAVEGEW